MHRFGMLGKTRAAAMTGAGKRAVPLPAPAAKMPLRIPGALQAKLAPRPGSSHPITRGPHGLLRVINELSSSGEHRVGNPELFADQMVAMLTRAGVTAKHGPVQVTLADSERVRDLNKTALGHDQPTDVLAFRNEHTFVPTAEELKTEEQAEVRSRRAVPPSLEVDPQELILNALKKKGAVGVGDTTKPTSLGTIFISIPFLKAEAKRTGSTVRRELPVIAAHALSHLLGHDHEYDEDAERMMRAEEYLLDAVRAMPSSADLVPPLRSGLWEYRHRKEAEATKKAAAAAAKQMDSTHAMVADERAARAAKQPHGPQHTESHSTKAESLADTAAVADDVAHGNEGSHEPRGTAKNSRRLKKM